MSVWLFLVVGVCLLECVIGHGNGIARLFVNYFLAAYNFLIVLMLFHKINNSLFGAAVLNLSNDFLSSWY